MVLFCVRLSIDMGPPFFFCCTPISLLSGDRIFRAGGWFKECVV